MGFNKTILWSREYCNENQQGSDCPGIEDSEQQQTQKILELGLPPCF